MTSKIRVLMFVAIAAANVSLFTARTASADVPDPKFGYCETCRNEEGISFACCYDCGELGICTCNTQKECKGGIEE